MCVHICVYKGASERVYKGQEGNPQFEVARETPGSVRDLGYYQTLRNTSI